MSTHARIGLLLLCVAGLAAGCSSGKKTSDKDLNLINRTQLQGLLNGRDRATLVLIDVRPARDFAEGHIPGALNIPVIELKKADPRLGEARTIVVYGSGKPDDLLSWAAAKKLVAVGYTNVHDFRGGMEEWLGLRDSQRPLMDDRMQRKMDMH